MVSPTLNTQQRQAEIDGVASNTNRIPDSKNRIIENLSTEYCTIHPPESHELPNGAVPLSKYIERTETKLFGKFKSDHPIFSQSSGTCTEPMLQKDRQNRILAFAGCFNPPHLGHLELLAHVFLRTDRRTIAAMLIPVGGTLHGKHGAMLGEKRFQLTKDERADLLQDELLERFSWVFRGAKTDVPDFEETLIREARMDGYEISFTGLTGSDHGSSIGRFGHSSWGTGNVITSDITRPSEWLHQTGAQPKQLKGCGSWRKILPVQSTQCEDKLHCWPCWKLKAICPDLEPSVVQTPTDTSRRFFGGIMVEILSRCHESDGITWVCHRKNERRDCVWFLPSGRQYPIDNRRPNISSTLVRKVLNETNPRKLHDAIQFITMNPTKLLSILNLEAVPKVHGNCGKILSEEDIELDALSLLVHTGEGPRDMPFFMISTKAKDDGNMGINTETALQRFKRRRLTM